METSNLKFSHLCAGITYNNLNLEAYYIDSETYQINRFYTQACGRSSGHVETITISIDDYDNLDSDNYNSLIRFTAVDNLFTEQRENKMDDELCGDNETGMTLN